MKVNFYMESQYLGGTQFYAQNLGGMLNMAAMLTNAKFFHQNWWVDFHQTLYVVSGTPAHHRLFK